MECSNLPKEQQMLIHDEKEGKEYSSVISHIMGWGVGKYRRKKNVTQKTIGFNEADYHE
jgi:hypothetical protein